jgi:hypothetical protein
MILPETGNTIFAVSPFQSSWVELTTPNGNDNNRSSIAKHPRSRADCSSHHDGAVGRYIEVTTQDGADRSCQSGHAGAHTHTGTAEGFCLKFFRSIVVGC